MAARKQYLQHSEISPYSNLSTRTKLDIFRLEEYVEGLERLFYMENFISNTP